MNLPILGNVFIINNLRTEVPNTVDDVEVLDEALRTAGFNVKIHNDCTAQVRVHYRPQWSPQGNVFTPVCHSVHREGVCRTPPAGTPPRQPPSGRYTSGRNTPWKPHPPARYTPWQVHLLATIPPSRYILPTATAADGTHPTGMCSCSLSIDIVKGVGGHRKFLTQTQLLSNSLLLSTLVLQQECILVGCVLSASWPYLVVTHVSRGFYIQGGLHRGLIHDDVRTFTS